MKFNVPTLPENSVTVAKDVQDDPNAAGKEFEFQIELKDGEGNPLISVYYTDQDGTTGTMPLTNGKGNFFLEDRETRTFKLAVNYTYKVTEINENQGNYKTTWSGETTGKLNDSDPVIVTCINTLQSTDVVTDKTVSGTTTRLSTISPLWLSGLISASGIFSG